MSRTAPRRPRRPLATVAFIAIVAALLIGLAVGVLVLQAERPTTAEPSAAPTTAAAPTATVFPTASALSVAAGTITGQLGYPSEVLPAMKIFAISTLDAARWYRVDTELSRSQIGYTLGRVPAGTYRVYAYTRDSTPANYAAGSYTESVRCGLQPPCTDHTVIVITVREGATTSGVDLRDWYVPLGTFPPPPQ